MSFSGLDSTIAELEKVQRSKTALDIFAEMKQRGLQPNVITYSALSIACIKAGKSKTALDVLQR